MTTTTASTSSMFAQITERLAAIEKTLSKLSETINGNGKPGVIERLLRVELKTCEQSTDIIDGIAARKLVTDDLQSRVKIIENILPALVAINRILTFIGVAVGGSVIAFIWAIVTHSVQIVK